MYFLTEIDPHAALKGSRDPLGVQPVWTHFGRKVVGNLTTVTRSVRNFTTLMLAQYFADELIESGKASEDDRLELFLKLEQLAAYCRVHELDDDSETREQLLGITRVRRRLREEDTVTISAKRDYQILSNQKTYGLWGLYSVAARNSGLSEQESSRPTPESRELIDKLYRPKLAKGKRDDIVLDLILEGGTFDIEGKHKKLASVLADILEPTLDPEERDFYHEALTLGGHSDVTKGRQHELWDLITEVNDGAAADIGWDDGFSFEELTEIIKRARTQKKDALASALEEIQVIEPLLAAATYGFGFLLDRNGQKLDNVAKEMSQTWPGGLTKLQPQAFEAIVANITKATPQENAERFYAMCATLHAGDYKTFLETAIEQNNAVLKNRGGAPWVVVTKGAIKVRFRAEATQLPSKEELENPWVFTYFINSLKRVGARIMGKLS